jgi:Mrp family chromosome partitioning ATPase
VHTLFEVPLTPGLCEVLRGEAALSDVIIAGNPLGIYLVPAGRCDASALQSLACDRLRDLCDELKQRFDFIVADSAPVLPVADSLLVGQQTDGVIISVRESISRIPQILEAHRRMDELGVRMLGAVVHGRVRSHDGYSQYYSGNLNS